MQRKHCQQEHPSCSSIFLLLSNVPTPPRFWKLRHHQACYSSQQPQHGTETLTVKNRKRNCYHLIIDQKLTLLPYKLCPCISLSSFLLSSSEQPQHKKKIILILLSCPCFWYYLSHHFWSPLWYVIFLSSLQALIEEVPPFYFHNIPVKTGGWRRSILLNKNLNKAAISVLCYQLKEEISQTNHPTLPSIFLIVLVFKYKMKPIYVFWLTLYLLLLELMGIM